MFVRRRHVEREAPQPLEAKLVLAVDLEADEPLLGRRLGDAASVEHEAREVRGDVVGAGGPCRENEDRSARKGRGRGASERDRVARAGIALVRRRFTRTPVAGYGECRPCRRSPEARSPSSSVVPSRSRISRSGSTRSRRGVRCGGPCPRRCDRARPSTPSRTAGDNAPRVYGVNTGFGALSETRISASDIRALQRNLVRSHSTGVGPDLPVAEVRGMILLRAQVLALGCTRACARSSSTRSSRCSNKRRPPAHPGAGVRRRVGGSRAARAPGARDDRRGGGARSRTGRRCRRPRR